MVVLEETTLIRAPIERCFDLSRSIDLHTRSTARTGEQAIAGVTTGLIAFGEEVTWRARHFGVSQSMTSRITAFDRPRSFQDRMVRGAFHSFEHDHCFAESGQDLTEMCDVLRFSALPAILGILIEPVLRTYSRRFLRERNELLRRIAESDEWRAFLPST